MECDGLGIGLFIVREALGILGHRIDVASTTCRGSRFSIFVARAAKNEGLSTDNQRRDKTNAPEAASRELFRADRSA
jgi:hypothetical protein